MFVFAIFASLLLRGAFGGEYENVESDDWAFHEVLDDAQTYHLYWSLEKDTITFKIEVATKGWIGFGLSTDGALPNSDLIFTWAVGDKTYLYDYMTKKENRLMMDSSQDWKLLSGFENKTHTVVIFSRKINTCDPMDHAITNGTNHVMFAYFDKDPESKQDINYRQALWRSKHVLLLKPRIYMEPMPEDVRYFDVRAENFSPPEKQETFYYCRIVKGPQLKKKHHIIKFSQVIRPQHQKLVHHGQVYKCTPKNKQEAEEAVAYGGAECNAKGLPSLFHRCSTTIAVFSLGGKTMVFPTQAGMPIGEQPDEYYMIEMHYNNKNFTKGLVDNSGMRLYYTPKLRKYDASAFWIMISEYAHLFTVIPPGQENFIIATHAHPRCLEMGMAKSGINIFVVYLHAHMTSRKMRLRHFRKDKELPHIAEDMQYSSEDQFYRYLWDSVNVKPGDHLVMECQYDTRLRNSTVFFGFGERQEMCEAIFFYYPSMSIATSETYLSLEAAAGLTGMNTNDRDYGSTHLEGFPNPYFEKYMLGYDWNESQMCTTQDVIRYSPQPTICHTVNEEKKNLTRIRYPEKFKPYQHPSLCPNQPAPKEEMESACSNKESTKKTPTKWN